jgi:alkaline phosphatase D
LALGARPRICRAFKGTNDGSLEGALKTLNMWGKKPEHVIRLYSAIYNALATNREASFATVAADKTVQGICAESGTLHLGGPMLGCIQNDSVKVWVRTRRPAAVEVRARVNGEARTFGPVRSTPRSDLTAIVPVTGLAPGTQTRYEVLVDGRAIPVPGHASITTPPASRDTPTRIAFGTCSHRWGLGNEKQAAMILKRAPHAMLLYGDIAVQDRRNDLGMHRADYALRDFHPAWRNIASAIPVYTSWDDHDYFANDAWGIPKKHTDEDRRGVRKVFTQAWNNPYYGLGDDGGGIFQHTRIGPCDIIMTDNRYFRQKNGKHAFLGARQMEWLLATLRACEGPFIIMSCGTMWSDYVSNGKDSWGRYDPEGREEIFDLIEKNRIAGVLLVSGDRHGARGFRIPRPSGYEFYEFEPASLGGRTGPPPTNSKWHTQLYGFSNKFAFGEFTFDTSRADPTVTFRLIQDSGDTLYEATLRRSQLTPAG